MNNQEIKAQDEKRTSKTKVFFQKFKKIKGFEIAIVVILISVMLLIAFSTFGKKETKGDEVTSNNELEIYCDYLESKLNNVLSQINGVGTVKTMITLTGGYEQKLAYTQDQSSTTGAKNETTTSNVSTSQNVVYVVKDGVETPLIQCVENPKIAGVVVVSSGASDVNVKLDIIRAVSTLLNVDVSCIEVLISK